MAAEDRIRAGKPAIVELALCPALTKKVAKTNAVE
jgi:hypothetical protein